jgi:AraC-like DNA-binding protein
MYGKSERFEDYDLPGHQPVSMAFALARGASRGLPPMRRARLLLVETGAAQVHVGASIWICGPGSTLWLPGDCGAIVSARSACRIVATFLPGTRKEGAIVRRVALTRLVNAIVCALAETPTSVPMSQRARRLGRLLLDELRFTPAPSLQQPWPRHAKLRQLCDTLVRDLGQSQSAVEIGAGFGISERTLSRRFLQETGMSPAHWHRTARLVAALTEIANGESVYNAAISVGFSNASSLCTAFKRSTGTTLLGYFRAGTTRSEFDEAAFFAAS